MTEHDPDLHDPIDPDSIPDDSQNPETLAAFRETLERGHRKLQALADAQLQALTPQERAILEQRFNTKRPSLIERRVLARLRAVAPASEDE